MRRSRGAAEGIASDWTELARSGKHIQPLAFVGRYHGARRCIDPPSLELSPLDGATVSIFIFLFLLVATLLQFQRFLSTRNT